MKGMAMAMLICCKGGVKMYICLFYHIVCLLFLTRFATVMSDSSKDVVALLNFKKGIEKDPLGSVEDTWSQGNVDSHGCPSGWHGVTCLNGVVTGISLQGLGLSGLIKTGTLGSLTGLTALLLSDNFFTGPLPDDLGKLTSLQQLDLSKNLLNGPIPVSLGQLQDLRNLSLAHNSLTGSIPDIFKNLKSLEEVDLHMNILSGSIPTSLVLLQKIVVLDLSLNSINGSIPDTLDALQNLQVLDFHQNKLSGPIGAGWMSLKSIQKVDFSSNQLSGLLPWLQTGPMLLPPDLIYVNLSGNQLSGQLAPESAESLFANKLQILDLSSNQLSGDLPSFEFVFSLRTLKLNDNLFSGIVPPALLSTQATVLETLDLSSNRLSGRIGLISAARLDNLNLSSNMLTGGLPARLGGCATVDLSNNLFSGDLSALKNWGNTIETVDLSNNSLSGILPNDTAQLLRLISLNISRNSLSGLIPPLFGSFRKLAAIDLSYNQLSGEIPSTFFYSASLSYLSLSNNQLLGAIPIQGLSSASSKGPLINSSLLEGPSSFAPLRSLDLSSNQLNSSIPPEIGSLSSLEMIKLNQNNFTGQIPSQISQLDYLQELDLSNNCLEGAIPSDLPAGLQKLNLSNNQLSGNIPVELEHRFPPSAFFPGNEQLRSTDLPGWNPSPNGKRPESILVKHEKATSPAFKASIIGGCIGGIIILVTAGFFIYHRRRLSKSRGSASTSVFRVVEKGYEHHHGKAVSPQKFETGYHADTESGSALPMGLPQKHTYSPNDSQKHVIRNNYELKSEPAASKKGIMNMNLSPTSRYRSFQATAQELLSVECPAVLKAKSPDKLAGDLFLIDNAVIFTAEELSRAPAEVLGRSSHGTSYKATLDSGHELTVKWLKEGLAKSKKEFTTEAKKFGVIRHPNIIPLRGYYWGPREHEKLILTDYITFGSLAGHLSEKSGRKRAVLSWPQRLHIAVGVARGLMYLHNEHRLCHGNLKATNVLLDGTELNARLTDYSLHRLMTAAGTANQILNAGALGYQAPELANVKKPKPTLKADVYAFGVILLELVTGRNAGDIISTSAEVLDLPDWVRSLNNDGRGHECFDRTLIGTEGEQPIPKGMDLVLTIALRCILPVVSRPTINIVYEELVTIKAT